MEKTHYLVVNKRDEKKINELKRLLSLSGIYIEELLEENKQLKNQVYQEFETLRKELKDYISESMKTIETNVSKTAESNNKNLEKQIQTYLFKGHSINEDK